LRVGVSRKTLSELERGVAEHVSLKTVMKALSLAGFVLEASLRRPHDQKNEDVSLNRNNGTHLIARHDDVCREPQDTGVIE